jgi:hypothetical protein
METQQIRKTRTITLTDRPPVRIVEDEWPVIAQAYDESRRDQTRRNGELVVRRHRDGRTLVHGTLDIASVWTGTESRRDGVLLPADASAAEIVAAIRKAGSECGLPERVIRECIADLPPEDL